MPVWYLLFLSGVTSYVLEPCVERVSDIVVPFGDTTTDSAAGRMLTSIMTVDRSADGSICACVVADSRGALYLRQTEPPAECGAHVSVIHWGGSFLCDKVCTRFGARPK